MVLKKIKLQLILLLPYRLVATLFEIVYVINARCRIKHHCSSYPYWRAWNVSGMGVLITLNNPFWLSHIVCYFVHTDCIYDPYKLPNIAFISLICVEGNVACIRTPTFFSPNFAYQFCHPMCLCCILTTICICNQCQLPNKASLRLISTVHGMVDIWIFHIYFLRFIFIHFFGIHCDYPIFFIM
jgi:hypothetical protein